MKPTLKQSNVSVFRLARHHFLDQKPVGLTTICHDICGAQAQLMSAAELQLWARNHGLTRTEIHSALWEKRTLVKTSLMRQTLHLIPTVDFFIYINALRRSRTEALQRKMSKYAGVTQKDTDALNAAIVEALHPGPMTQPELMEQILPKAGKNVKKWAEIAWNIQIFRSALVEGLICYGPERGKKATFVRTDQWLSKQKEVAELAAKQILLRRYLRAFGPATLQDFSKWSGITVKEVKPILETLADELVDVQIENRNTFILHEDLDQLIHSGLVEPIVRLLPAFDPYLLGHADKNQLVDLANYKRVYRNQGWISPVILFNGKVIGVWSHIRRGQRLILEIKSFEKSTKTIRSKIEEEAASLGKFLEASFEIKFK